ncbi:putative hyaluronoglucosaminidase [Apostichopus japonicus]|uniref:Putative hyaluronoglucosaminidase n=1 Tax=Stichopus japonicus TaxID=307972 RepID=A0A2G8JCA5_STIJA|nr:putative hyaluronoglucosaminidase [Apostichopus japonicus]
MSCGQDPKSSPRKITVASVKELSAAIKRKPIIWDNVHANDYDQKRLFLGPFQGRSTDLRPYLNGFLTNPNCEYNANFMAIHTLGAWFRDSENRPITLQGFHCSVSSSDASLYNNLITLISYLLYLRCFPSTNISNNYNNNNNNNNNNLCIKTSKFLFICPENPTVSAEIKLETEGENVVQHQRAHHGTYNPALASQAAISDWVKLFRQARDAQGKDLAPLVLSQPTVLPQPVPPMPSINTCMAFTSTTTSLYGPALPETVSEELQKVKESLVGIGSEAFKPPLNPMNSLVAPPPEETESPWIVTEQAMIL